MMTMYVGKTGKGGDKSKGKGKGKDKAKGKDKYKGQVRKSMTKYGKVTDTVFSHVTDTISIYRKTDI